MQLINKHNFFPTVCEVFAFLVLGQYVILMVLIHGGMHVYAKWFGTQYAPTGYRDIFISFTIPYVIGAIAYYMVFFRECTKANRMIRDLKSSME